MNTSSPQILSDLLINHDDVLNIGVSIFFDNQQLAYANSAFFRLLLPGESNPPQIKSFSELKQYLSTQNITLPELTATGRDITLNLADARSLKLKYTALGQTLTICMIEDVSELVHTQELLEDALMLGGSGYWIYDLVSREVLMSRSLKTFFSDNQLEEIRAHGPVCFAIEEDRPALREKLAAAVKSGGRFTAEGYSENRSGKRRRSNTWGDIVCDIDGRPRKIRAFVKDTTREYRISEKLKMAKDLALSASKAKSEFLATLSHEIRTPMNGVLGMSEFLMSMDLPSEIEGPIDVIQQSAMALMSMLNDILDYSKLESGVVEISMAPFNLRKLVEEVAQLMAGAVHKKQMEIIVNYDADLPEYFIGDSYRLRQVLTNLVNNAVKFTHEGFVEIKVEMADFSKARKIVKLSVKDTGIGIAPEKLEQIFEKFTQADSSTTRQFGGTGLGLAICKVLVELMNGLIKVRSVQGEGAVFSFALALEEDLQARASSVEVKPTNLTGKRALIIDDIGVNCEILTRYFDQLGMNSCAFIDPNDALNHFRAHKDGQTPFDVIVCDFAMPSMTGLDIAERINGIVKNAPPIIILSSIDAPIDSEACRRLNITGVLCKPYTHKNLRNSLQEALKNVIQPVRLDDAAGCKLESNAKRKVECLQRPAQNDPMELDPAQLDPIEIGHESKRATAPLDSLPEQGFLAEKLKILVAEDFVLNQEVVRMMLSGSRYVPVFAHHGRDAVERFVECPKDFAAILMDISMPEMDGFEATQNIRDLEKRLELPHTPIVAVTGHAHKEDHEKCIAAGMDDYMVKPLSQKILLEKLGAWTSKLGIEEISEIAPITEGPDRIKSSAAG